MKNNKLSVVAIPSILKTREVRKEEADDEHRRYKRIWRHRLPRNWREQRKIKESHVKKKEALSRQGERHSKKP